MPHPMMNITISVPLGTSDHGDPDILCVPSKWNDVMLFYAVNYLAHAVTVKSLPGEKIENAIFFIALALIYPYSGLLRGMEAIARRAYWTRGNDLQRACRAGALCIVVRSREWKPVAGQIISNCKIQKLTMNESLPAPEGGFDETDFALVPALWCTKLPKQLYEGFLPNVINNDRTIHGGYLLPPGYMIAFLPSNAIVETSFSTELADVSIASSNNMLKGVVAIIQVCFASVTIYKTRGDQVERYGYAAFGLTVLPYVIMSMVNLLGNLLTPDFPTLYLVESPEMMEARARGGSFDGVIGVVKHQPHDYGYSLQFDETDGGFVVHQVEQPLAIGAVGKSGSTAPPAENASRSPEFRQSANASSYTQDMELAMMRSLEGNQAPAQVAAGTQPNIPAKFWWGDWLWKIYPDQQTTNGRSVNLKVPSTKLPDEEAPTTRLLPAPIPRTVRCSFHLRVPAASNFVCKGARVWGKRRLTLWGLLSFIMVSVPFAIISGLTHFQKGHSTLAQRVWTMSWLVMGTFWGSTLPSIFELIKYSESWMWEYFKAWTRESGLEHHDENARYIYWGFRMLRMGFLLTCAVFPIGGFVVVGQMLNSYGNCVKLS